MNDLEPDVTTVCDNCGALTPKFNTPDGRFCDEMCADAYNLR